MSANDLGRQVRIYRAAHAMTQAALAKKLGISPTAVSLLETGKPTPQLTDAQLAKIAKVTAQVAA